MNYNNTYYNYYNYYYNSHHYRFKQRYQQTFDQSQYNNYHVKNPGIPQTFYSQKNINYSNNSSNNFYPRRKPNNVTQTSQSSQLTQTNQSQHSNVTLEPSQNSQSCNNNNIGVNTNIFQNQSNNANLNTSDLGSSNVSNINNNSYYLHNLSDTCPINQSNHSNTEDPNPNLQSPIQFQEFCSSANEFIQQNNVNLMLNDPATSDNMFTQNLLQNIFTSKSENFSNNSPISSGYSECHYNNEPNSQISQINTNSQWINPGGTNNGSNGYSYNTTSNQNQQYSLSPVGHPSNYCSQLLREENSDVGMPIDVQAANNSGIFSPIQNFQSLQSNNYNSSISNFYENYNNCNNLLSPTNQMTNNSNFELQNQIEYNNFLSKAASNLSMGNFVTPNKVNYSNNQTDKNFTNDYVVKILNLNPKATKTDLHNFFLPSKIVSVRFEYDNQDCFAADVLFESYDDCLVALGKNGQSFMGCQVQISFESTGSLN